MKAILIDVTRCTGCERCVAACVEENEMDAATADAVRDYVAGMTDRFAADEHDRLFKLTGFRP